MLRRRAVSVGLALTCLLAVLPGCTEDVTAVLGTENAYSLYGVLNPRSGMQAVIVFPIEGRLEEREPEPLDAQFTSTDLESGEMRTWQDSIIHESKERIEHVFWSEFRAVYGHTYRVEIERPDGARTTAEVAVPVESELVLQDPVQTPFVLLPVLVNSSVPRLMKIEAEYYIKYASGERDETTTRVVVPYGGKEEEVDEGWLVSLNLSHDYDTLRNAARAQPMWDRGYGVALLDVTLRLLVVSEEWDPPGGEFDPEVLVQPGTMSNVENGYGFLGAGYRLEHTWRPPEEILSAAGFTPLGG